MTLPGGGAMPGVVEWEAIVTRAVATFGLAVKQKLAVAKGQREDQLTSPTQAFLMDLIRKLGLDITIVDQISLADRKLRPDLGLAVGSAQIGVVELKAPGKTADPESFRLAHDLEQWEKLSLLPNVLLSDGQQWALYRSGRRIGPIASMNGSLDTAGIRLAPDGSSLAEVLREFLTWQPESPRGLGDLITSVAGLCRLLRSEVLDAIKQESVGTRHEKVVKVLAEEWRQLLLPGSSDADFADQFAQTVTFGLLLSRAVGIDFTGRSIHEIAKLLYKQHLLVGKALDYLTEQTAENSGLAVTLETLKTVIAPVDWSSLDNGTGNVYSRLYEEFLAEYDPVLRRKTGVYYTPKPIVETMVRLTDQILQSRLRRPLGFAAPDVTTVDPAMGTGTFLASILDTAAAAIAERYNTGLVPSYLRELATDRLIGFERQIGPLAVAELQIHGALRHHGAEAPTGLGRQYGLLLADTLDDPQSPQSQFGSYYRDFAESRLKAAEVKGKVPITVVIGNPPYLENAKMYGRWITRRATEGSHEVPGSAPLDAFRAQANGRNEFKLASMSTYFWRWATWKVFDAHPDQPAGIVTFITPSGYCTGPAFKGMREYMRRNADEGWIIDLSPEGQRSSAGTRFFPEVQGPICIGIFVRAGNPQLSKPARIRYISVSGTYQEKVAGLEGVSLDDPGWRDCPSDWQEPFLPEADSSWLAMPLLADLMPWSSSGIKTNRRWVIAPSVEVLKQRWNRLTAAAVADKPKLMKETDSRTIDTEPGRELTGIGMTAIRNATESGSAPVRIGYRSFDRQWLIRDPRLIDRMRDELWNIHSECQVFTTEVRTKSITSGPAVTFTELIPDTDHYHGRGGQVIPLYRNPGGTIANFSTQFLRLLSRHLDTFLSPEQVLSYIAGTVAHSGYTDRFTEQLLTPKVRVPVTADPALWQRAVALGSEVIWLHTFGERFADVAANRPRSAAGHCAVELPRGIRPEVRVPIPDSEGDMPETISYDPATLTLRVGRGAIAPVLPSVWEYQVCNMRVIRHWFGYRRRKPSGLITSPLDRVVAVRWPPSWTIELLDLLTVLSRLVQLEPAQAKLLSEILEGPMVNVEDLSRNTIPRRAQTVPPEQPALFG